MLLQAALNGPFTKSDHPAMPVSVEELVHDAAECVAAGARAVHLHPRDADRAESLDAAIVDAVVAAVRSRCGVPVGVRPERGSSRISIAGSPTCARGPSRTTHR